METNVLAPQLGFVASRIAVQTAGPHHFIDISNEVQERVSAAGIRSGIVVVTIQHTTAALLVNEHEPELLKDLDGFLDGLAPEASAYLHNDVPCLPGERPNGHAHCQSLLLQTSVTMPLVDGRLCLGRWQRVFLVELDCARPREAVVTILGT